MISRSRSISDGRNAQPRSISWHVFDQALGHGCRAINNTANWPIDFQCHGHEHCIRLMMVNSQSVGRHEVEIQRKFLYFIVNHWKTAFLAAFLPKIVYSLTLTSASTRRRPSTCQHKSIGRGIYLSRDYIFCTNTVRDLYGCSFSLFENSHSHSLPIRTIRFTFNVQSGQIPSFMEQLIVVHLLAFHRNDAMQLITRLSP